MTDHRETASREDWRFADKMFLAGLKVSGVRWLQRVLMYLSVRSCIGWRYFRAKPYTLEERMKGWLPHLEADHRREG